jgi:1-acyl-sn-glycerol-3-phosphate acyltransferase
MHLPHHVAHLLTFRQESKLAMNDLSSQNPGMHRGPGHPAAPERMSAEDVQELFNVVNAIVAGTANATGSMLSQLSSKASRQLQQTVRQLSKWVQKSSTGSRIVGKTIFDWFQGNSTDEFGMDHAFVEAARPVLQFFYREYFRVDTSGGRWLPTYGPALLVANHSGAIPYDGLMLSQAVYNSHPLKREVRFLVDDFVPTLPFFGTLAERFGAVRACHENAMQLLAAGHIVALFPEGIKGVEKPFEQRYQLQRFGRGGVIRLAIRAGVPIVPTAIVGAEEIAPVLWTSERLGRAFGMPYVPFTPTFPWLGPLGFVPMPVKWKIAFGKPIDYARFTPEDADNYDFVKAETEALRGKVDRLLKETLAKRPSIWMD